MKTEITMNKTDLVNMVKKAISSNQVQKVKMAAITANVVLLDNKKEDFKEIIFTMEINNEGSAS